MASDEERQALLLEELRKRSSMDAADAWNFGHSLGFYKGGDGSLAKNDLRALSNRRLARRHDGFWRHINEPDHIRSRCKRWADYWTAPRRGRE